MKKRDDSIVNIFMHFSRKVGHHLLLKRFHSDEEKRRVDILRPKHYEDRLGLTHA